MGLKFTSLRNDDGVLQYVVSIRANDACGGPPVAPPGYPNGVRCGFCSLLAGLGHPTPLPCRESGARTAPFPPTVVLARVVGTVEHHSGAWRIYSFRVVQARLAVAGYG